MRSVLTALGVLIAGGAVAAPMYLVFSTQEAAEERSRAQCAVDGCRGLKWPVVPLPGGQYGVEVENPRKPSVPNPSGLTIYEIGRMKTKKQVGLE